MKILLFVNPRYIQHRFNKIFTTKYKKKTVKRILFNSIELISTVIAMRNNNYLNLIKFKLKTSSSETFL